MTGSSAARAASLALLVASVAGAASCVTFLEIPVQIPIQAKIDVSEFQRVLVAGFLTGGSDAIDPNTETARLLRSQLRSNSEMKVVDADVLSLIDEVRRRDEEPGATAQPAQPVEIKTIDDLQPYEGIFQDEEYWKQIGSEYENPLIVTGSLVFTEVSRTGSVSKPESYVDDATGETRYRVVTTTSEQRGYAIDTKFVFIDGRTGKELHTESLKDETLYQASVNTPALSAYFELMDKILPTFRNTLSTQKIRGTRYLIK